MTISEADELSSYHPTPFVMREVVSRIGGARAASKILLMGDNGPRTVRAWVSGRLPIPRLCWAVLIAYDRSGEVSV